MIHASNSLVMYIYIYILDWALIFMLMVFVFMLSTAVSPSISMSPSCCRHVCFLMPTGFSIMRAVSPFMPSVSFFMLISPFLMLPPLLLMLHGAGGTGGGAPFYKTRPFYAELTFFNAAPILFLRSMRRFPSISMSLPPSPCLHPVVDTFVFLCPQVFPIMRAVSPFMPSVSFLC